MSSCPLGQRTSRRLWFLLLRRTLVLRLTVMDSWNALSVVARAYWFVELLVVFRAPSGWNAMIVYNVYIHVCIVDMNVLWTWSCMHLQLLPWSSIAKCRCCFAFTDFHELSLTVTTKPSWSPARLDFSLRPTVACPNHWAVNYGTWRKMPDLEAVDMGLSENNVMYIRIKLYLEWCLTFFDHIPPLRVYGIPLYTHFFRHIHMITIRVPLLNGGLPIASAISPLLPRIVSCGTQPLLQGPHLTWASFLTWQGKVEGC